MTNPERTAVDQADEMRAIQVFPLSPISAISSDREAKSAERLSSPATHDLTPLCPREMSDCNDDFLPRSRASGAANCSLAHLGDSLSIAYGVKNCDGELTYSQENRVVRDQQAASNR